MLFMISGFLIFLAVLFVMMDAQAPALERRAGRRVVPIPSEGVRNLALGCFVAGFGTLAVAFYAGAAH